METEKHSSGFAPVKCYCVPLAAVAGGIFPKIQTGIDAFFWISLLYISL